MDGLHTPREGQRPERIVVVGGGFAGVWSALGAARCLDQRGIGPERVGITLISADPYLTIRPRLYEPDLSQLRVPLDDLLVPAGVERVEGRVTAIDTNGRAVIASVGGQTLRQPFDRLVLAAGSQVVRPALPGLLEHAFTVDNYPDAQRLQAHLQSLPHRHGEGRYSAVVVGAGFTGLEVATELAGRLRTVAQSDASGAPVRVTLVGAAPEVGPDLGPRPRPAILNALRELGITLRLGEAAVDIGASGVTLASGHRLSAETTVWTAGLRASPLAAGLGVTTDALGRLPVDSQLRVGGLDGVFAAGDVARAMTDSTHVALMSCQHAIPMGKFAGHNAAADLLAGELLPYEQLDYVTCIDLGSAGAVFTRGWDRTVLYTGPAAKRLKEQINQRDIYPPLTAVREDLLDAARPEAPPLDGLVRLGQTVDSKAAVG